MEERTILSLLLLLAVSGEAKITLSLLANSSELNQLWGINWGWLILVSWSKENMHTITFLLLATNLTDEVKLYSNEIRTCMEPNIAKYSYLHSCYYIWFLYEINLQCCHQLKKCQVIGNNLASMPLPLANPSFSCSARHLAEVKRLLYGNPLSTILVWFG